MTTATAAPNQYESLDFEIPEELPERGRRWVGRILHAGVAMPPERMAAKIAADGRVVRPQFHLVIEPLSFKYNSDRSKGFEDDYEHGWYAIYDKNGELVRPGSNFDDLKKAFAKNGFVITNKAQAEALSGLVWEFETIKKPNKRNVKNEETGEWEEVEGKPSYVMVPFGLTEDQNYVHPSAPQVIDRPKTASGGSAPSAANVDTNAAVALPKLAEILNGKTEAEYLKALTDSKDITVMKPPYIVHASSNPHELTVLMTKSTLMKQDGDKLVKVGS